MDFEKALRLVGIAEGGYSNHPQDTGGETICGLAREKNPDLPIWNTLDTWKARGITDGGQLEKLARADPQFMRIVQAVYRGRYWNIMRLDDLPPVLRYPVFSAAVNIGCGAAGRLLQRVAGIKEDGRIGPQTISAISKQPADAVYVAFLDRWREYYHAIVKAKPSQQVFLRGWLNRTYQVEKDNKF